MLQDRVARHLARNLSEEVGLIQFLPKAEWETHPASVQPLGVRTRTPRSSKGLEFRSGVLFEPLMSQAEHSDDWSRWSKIYVALTRFRDEVEIIVDRETGSRLIEAGVGAR